ncbi:MAG: AAA family ATPase [Thiofilum sp.]|uniref:AAA family ATPase n=1 Tax=Thiofilum sp. TaxID=2212733 RepID=UPI0025EB2A17|nr:AAA family ATPase [Thiofilum sp.]MBK8454825.1 AAA family ATPase [Thiofilum sp.]
MDASPIIPISVASLELTNFRLFSELKVELHPELTIFVAPNAGGKTSILDAIFYHLCLFLEPNTVKKSIKHDIKTPSPIIPLFEIQLKYSLMAEQNQAASPIKNISCINKMIPYIERPEKFYWVSRISDNNHVMKKNSIYELSNDSNEERIKLLSENIAISNRVSEALRILMAVIETELNPTILKSGSVDTLSLFAYFSANRRLKTDSNVLYEYKELSRIQAFQSLLPSTDEFFNSFEAWLRERSISGLETRLAYQEQGITEEPPEDSHLKAISKVLATMLSSEVGIETVKYFASEKGIRAVTKSGERIDINQLSHGAKSILTIAAQLAMNSCALNPHLRDQAPEYTPGIVLIDEIDLHLHPKWQHHVLEDLRRCFPRMQFIVTTHSPAILSTVKREHIRVIEVDYSTGIGTATTPQSRSYGESIADTLETIMNVPSRPQNELVKRINAYLDWAENGDLTEDKSSERSALEQELGTEHHDLFNADLIIRRRKILAARG